jgi:hypothetical protein
LNSASNKPGFITLDREKLRVLAKPSHNSCLGTGVTGVVRGTNIHRICACVWRELRRRGIKEEDFDRHIAKDPPAVISKE